MVRNGSSNGLAQFVFQLYREHGGWAPGGGVLPVVHARWTLLVVTPCNPANPIAGVAGTVGNLFSGLAAR